MKDGIATGDLLVCDLNPVVGHEQGGRRPVVVVSHPRYAAVPGLMLVVPLTSRDRGLTHHIVVPAGETTGLQSTSYAMSEQTRVLSRRRAEGKIGEVGEGTLSEISRFVHMFVA